MNIEVITTPLYLTVYGLPGTATNKDYTGLAFNLSRRVWETVKGNGLKNKGKNIWVYEENEQVFAGIELEDVRVPGLGLQQKTIHLGKYAYFKHIGSYTLLKQVGMNMRQELKTRGFETCLPYVEIYGHWTNDENKSETELFVCLL